MEKHQELQKNIGLGVALSLVIGTVIGSGIFMKPSQVIELSGGPAMALWAWVVGGIITIAGGLTISELSTQIPKTGGLYVYIEEVYGKSAGYLSGWVQAIIYGPAIIGTLGLYFGTLCCALFGLGKGWITVFGIGSVVFLAVMNSLGTKLGGFIQSAATIGKMVPIVLIAVFGIWKGSSHITGLSVVSHETSFGAAILSALFAYDGWMLVGMVAGEIKNPQKVLPKAIIGGLSLVTACYLLVNIALLHVLSPQSIVHLGNNAAGTAAALLFGQAGGKLISIGILISIFGCMNGKIFTFPRIPFAMARRNELPFSGTLSYVHKKFATPVAAIALEAVLALIFMTIGSADRLSEIAVFIIFFFYTLAFFAVFILRKRHRGKKRAYSVPLYPIVPLIAIVGSLYIIGSTLMTSPADSIGSLALTVIGLPVLWIYRLFSQRQTALPKSDKKKA